ncbi:MAG: hypothetical protein JXA99_15195 [Candidatus Lokiarchaeota archaeon]|nr:hypothetical protein [Candidatus Lokiarchaeota archaeon]
MQVHDFIVKYILLDRGFYRKRILTLRKARELTVIIPGCKFPQTSKMIEDYLMNKGTRYCEGSMKVRYIKGEGQTYLKFDILLVAKRKYRLDDIKRDYRAKCLLRDKASKRIFPLIVLFSNPRGITKLRGNETYIRGLYRRRWLIEIEFREMNKLGFSFRLQGQDARLSILSTRALLYNIWQVQRYMLQKKGPNSKALELDEFLGKTFTHLYFQYISSMDL